MSLYSISDGRSKCVLRKGFRKIQFLITALITLRCLFCLQCVVYFFDSFSHECPQSDSGFFYRVRRYCFNLSFSFCHWINLATACNWNRSANVVPNLLKMLSKAALICHVSCAFYGHYKLLRTNSSLSSEKMNLLFWSELALGLFFLH